MNNYNKSLFFVRQIHWDIPCTQATIARGLKTLYQVLDSADTGTSAAASPSFFVNDWQEFKIGTCAGRQVLMQLEFCRGQATFIPLSSPRLKKLLLRQREHRFQPGNSPRNYTYLLFGYTPFRSQVYNTYRTTRSLSEKTEYLRSHLYNHLSELADRISWSANSPLCLEQIRIRKEKKARLGGVLQASFDLEFQTNLFIPEFLGLGRGAAMGLGVVRPLRETQSRTGT
jgi:hypothetical protein